MAAVVVLVVVLDALVVLVALDVVVRVAAAVIMDALEGAAIVAKDARQVVLRRATV